MHETDGGLEMTPPKLVEEERSVWEDWNRRREGGDERGENQMRGRA